MKVLRIGSFLLLSLSLPFVSAGQSLGSVAKKERERRDRNKKEGVAAREFHEEEVFGEEDQTPAEGETEESGEAPSDPSGEASIPGVKSNLEDAGERQDTESRERQRSEAEWRSRVSAARARIEEARERVQFFENLFLPPNGRYVDAHGNTVIRSLDHLQRLTREAKEELAAAELDWKQIQEEARRAGIPPGWLR